MNITLLKKEIKSNWLQLIIFLAVLTMYGVMVTMMYEPELGESLKMMAESMPEIFAAFGMAEVGETRGGMQLSFFQLEDPVLCQIRDEILNLDVNNLTPLEALNKLNDIKRIVKGK